MAEDPGSSKEGMNGLRTVSDLLEDLERAPSERAQSVIISEKLVPGIQNKG